MKKDMHVNQDESTNPTSQQEDASSLDDKELNKIILKKQRLEKRQENIKDTINWLEKRFPGCFKSIDPIPLKIGITKDIISLVSQEEDAPSGKSIKAAISAYANSFRYYSSFMKNSHRVDLEGKQAGEVSQEQKDFAKKIRKERFPFPVKNINKTHEES